MRVLARPGRSVGSLSVKATALDQAITDFAPAVGPQTTVVPFLNGMSHLTVLSQQFGEPALLAA